MALHKLVFDTTDADSRLASAQVGAVLYDAANDRLGVINASNELQVRDDDVNTALATIDSVLDSILVDTTSIDALLTALSKSEDAAHSSGDQGIMGLAVRNDVEGSLVSADGDYAPLQVDSAGRLRVIADIDISNQAEKAEDSAHVSGDSGNYVLNVRQDSLATSTSADGDYQSFKSNANGELYVIDTDGNALLTTIDSVLDAIKVDTAALVVDLAAIEVEQLAQGVTLDSILVDTSVIAGDTTSIDATLTALSKAEDAIHASGDRGIMSLAVRNDAGTALAADGDYIPLMVDAGGKLFVTTSEDNQLANTAIAAAVNLMSVANTAEDVVASPLANRKYLFVYNNGNKDTFIGQSGVTSANGFPLPPGSLLELRAGAAVDIEWVAGDTSQEIRTLELS